MTHHPSAASLRLHGARLLFPPVATLLFLVLTEYIARGTLSGDTFVQYIFPHAEAYLLAWGLLFLVWMAVDWLTRFAPLATLLSALLGCLPATVDFYTLQLRGEPFLPWDLMQVSEAAGVASAAGIHVQKSMVVSGVVVLALTIGSFFLYRGRQKLPWVQRLAGFAASTAATCALIFGVFLQPAVTQSLGILPDAWMQDRYYRYYGVITSFLTNLTNLEIDKPEDYSEEAVNAILDDVEAGEKYTTSPAWPDSYAAQTPADEQVKQPTILYVMDESYWDVSELEQYGFQFDTDVSANLHALQQTSAYGRVYSPSFGGGTCDVEFEALTGYSVSYLPSGSKPYQQHVTKPMFALPSYLKTQGYQTAAVHCFWARYWSRDTAYPNLGLDDFISLEKMHGVQKVRRHYWTTGLVTDDSMADQIIGQYETMKAQSDAPVFLHAVTMQNHTNYNKDNYPDDQRVKVTEAPAGLRASTVGALEDFATGIRDADAMLGRLTEYFSQTEEPVLLAFYGDHLPYLGDGMRGYQDIDSQVALPEAERDDPLCSYETPYVLWVNDAAAEVLDWERAVASLDLPEDRRLSACFLGDTVLELTGRDQDNAWFAFLSQLRRERPVVQAELYEDSEGQVRSLSSLSPERQDAIRRWRCWSYYKLQQKELR